jgi:hypothetical protein
MFRIHSCAPRRPRQVTCFLLPVVSYTCTYTDPVHRTTTAFKSTRHILVNCMTRLTAGLLSTYQQAVIIAPSLQTDSVQLNGTESGATPRPQQITTRALVDLYPNNLI